MASDDRAEQQDFIQHRYAHHQPGCEACATGGRLLREQQHQAQLELVRRRRADEIAADPAVAGIPAVPDDNPFDPYAGRPMRGTFLVQLHRDDGQRNYVHPIVAADPTDLAAKVDAYAAEHGFTVVGATFAGHQVPGIGPGEPGDHTALIDRFGDTWVRVDEHPGPYGPWWPITDGPAWEERGRNTVGAARDWDDLAEYGPFTGADPRRTATALTRVRAERALEAPDGPAAHAAAQPGNHTTSSSRESIVNLEATGPEEIRAAFTAAIETAQQNAEEMAGIAGTLTEAADRYESLQMAPSTVGHIRDAGEAFANAQNALNTADEELQAALADFNAHDGAVADTVADTGGNVADREVLVS
jgi:uncharacterized protein YukE